jgi:hypothetical protein
MDRGDGMTFTGFNPQVSPAGDMLSFGQSKVRVVSIKDGASILRATPGTRPHWLDAGTVAFYREGADGGVFVWTQRSGISQVSGAKGVSFCAKAGSWALYNLAKHALVVNGAQAATNDAGRAICVDGAAWALLVNGERVVKLSDGSQTGRYPAKVQIIAACFMPLVLPLVRCANGRVYFGMSPLDVTAVKGEHRPVLLSVGGDLCLATALPDRVLIRPLLETAKAIVLPGSDAGLTCTVAGGRFIGASCTSGGRITTFSVPVSTPMVDL